VLDICTQKEIAKHVAAHPGAAEFITAYGHLCHAVDDLIDRDNPSIKDYKLLMLDAYALAADVYSCWFYHQNLQWLYPVIKNIHRVYSDSILWEKSDVPWKREYADKLRCCGNEVIMAILEHLCHVPYPELRKISIAMRENAWLQHHDVDGRMV
jgi:hypothetical protein